MPSRATFILDNERRVVRHSSVYPRVVGRSVDEVLRTVQAIKEVDKKSNEMEVEVCIPSGWNQGEEVILNTFEGKKEYYSKRTAEKVDEIKTDEKSKLTATLTSGPEVSCPVL